MSFTVAVLKETREHERRVAMVPSQVERLARLGARVLVQREAGLAARLRDHDYAGVEFLGDPAVMAGEADVVLSVQMPGAGVIAAMKPGSWLLCFAYPQAVPGVLPLLRDRRISCLAMESVPRISRAQAMDALSSQAALAGYLAPLLGAAQLPRILPMMTTAVGSLRAARVLVMGLGVAGLQALATARRLGAVTEGYDVRPETREQAQSVGA
ncbi:MAG TPA: NAD(P)(+) transhydrogenase (Re/Si-specific) subunit alpha, partial [Xanthomonadaceae bacterium]|nr:NAD(P)(+) transhydrogenase (Re/Si-specific) subunit alpha [Xanthomonadaceae bacterium]